MLAKIVPIGGRSARAEVDVTSLQFKLEVYQKINRDWAHELDAYESRVLLAVVDRTIGWGQTEARFSAGALLNGDKVCGPLNISRRQLYRALASLEEKGFIDRRHPANQPEITFYKANFDRNQTMALNPPKSHKTATRCNAVPVPDRHTPVPDGHTPVPDRHSIYSNQPTGNHSTGNRSAALADRAPVEAVPVIREKKSNSAANRETGLPTHREAHAASVEAAWRAALAAAFPDAVEPVWTLREKGRAKQLADGWMHRHQISFIDFTDWAVRNWTQIRRKQFKWMTKAPPPEVPAFRFYAAMIDQFAKCWAEGKLTEWASAKERTEIEQMMSRGMTFEQAMSEAGKKNAMAQLRDEMRTREIKVRARERSVEAKLEQAKRLAEFSGAAPVHPQSVAAKAMRAKVEPKPRSAPTLLVEEFVPLSAPMVDPTRNPFDHDD